jgi:DNA-binding PadR family transcriptional regulator
MRAIGPWPAYELTRYMRTSAVRRCWPRTESRLYAEPRNLVAHGLAEVSTEHTGRRRRTVYAITSAGRRALSKWLGERSAPREMQDETLLRMLLSDHGTPEQLLATIRWGLDDLRATVVELTKISDRIRESGSPPEEREETLLVDEPGTPASLRRRLRLSTQREQPVHGREGPLLRKRAKLRPTYGLEGQPGALPPTRPGPLRLEVDGHPHLPNDDCSR